MQTEAQHFTAPHQVFLAFSLVPLLALALAGISFYFLYKHWHNLEPIHTLWALFYGTEALQMFAYDITLLFQHFTSFSVCPQNIVVFFTVILFYLSVVLLQADRWAAIYFNSKYKGLITNKIAVVGCCAVVLIAFVVSLSLFLIDSSYVMCAHPPSLRLTRRTTIYLEGLIRMSAVVLTAVVSSYAVRIKMKNNKVAPNVQLNHQNREEIGAGDRIRRERNTNDVFYIGHSSNSNPDIPDSFVDATVNEEESNFLKVLKEIIESNKMPLMIIIGGSFLPMLGWMYAGCETDNSCGEFLAKLKFVGGFQLLLIFVQILVTLANITKF